MERSFSQPCRRSHVSSPAETNAAGRDRGFSVSAPLERRPHRQRRPQPLGERTDRKGTAAIQGFAQDDAEPDVGEERGYHHAEDRLVHAGEGYAEHQDHAVPYESGWG